MVTEMKSVVLGTNPSHWKGQLNYKYLLQALRTFDAERVRILSEYKLGPRRMREKYGIVLEPQESLICHHSPVYLGKGYEVETTVEVGDSSLVFYQRLFCERRIELTVRTVLALIGNPVKVAEILARIKENFQTKAVSQT